MGFIFGLLVGLYGSGLIAFIGKEKLIDKQTDCGVVNHD